MIALAPIALLSDTTWTIAGVGWYIVWPVLLYATIVAAQMMIALNFIWGLLLEELGLGLPLNHVPNSRLEKARRWSSVL